MTRQPVGFMFPDPTAPTAADLSDSEVSWDVSGTFATTDSVNLYARIASGYRASSVQPASAFGNQSIAEPETNTSVEVGIKADLLDRRASVAFGVYRFEVEDQQLTAVGGGSNAVRLLNADKSIGYGAELDLQAYLTRQLLVTFGVSYNHTEIDDPSLQVATCFACTVTDPIDSVTGLASIDGNDLPQAPEWIANVTARYSVPIGSGEFFTFLDYAYRSEVGFFLYDSTEFTGPSLAELGLRVGYNWSEAKYQVALFGRNLTDEEVVTGGIDFNNLTGFINEPRIVGLQVSMRY
jgi:iron complex outermembrane receptor protein